LRPLKLWRKTLALGFVLFVNAGYSEELFASPFDSALIQQRSLHPINALLGLPAAASRPVGSSQWQVSLEHNNSFMGGDEAGESLKLDGESSALALRYDRRLNQCWQASTAAAFLSHSGGVFDRAIDDWHQWFQLPNAGRENFDYHLLEYRYANSDGRSSTLPGAARGFGDVQLAVQRILPCLSRGATGLSSPRDASLLRLGLKLPIGSREDWLGSERLDAWLDIQSPLYTVAKKVDLAASIGVLLIGQVEDLAETEPLAGFGVMGVQYRLKPQFSLLAQIDWHTAFFVSELRELGEFAASISAGFRYRTRAGQVIELSIHEDAVVDTSPDIVARLGVTWRPQ